jgi:phosphotransferase system enzyme I (PtsP)
MFSGGKSLEGFLGSVVKTICAHMQATVCSIYLYDEAKGELVLRATEGLSASCVGKVRLKLGEGITGTAVKELRHIREDNGSRNANFKYIPGTEEERFEAFLAVPILLGISRVGALVVQHERPGFFNNSDTQALRAIASQLAGAVENARLLLELQRSENGSVEEGAAGPDEPSQPAFIEGIAGSAGVVRGGALSFGEFSDHALEQRIAREDGNLGLEDFDKAVAATEKQLGELQEKMSGEMADLSASLIFNAHLLMLRDEMFSGAIRQAIRDGATPGRAVRQVVERFVGLFSGSPNPRMREKVQDVKDLGRRLLLAMFPEEGNTDADYTGRVVIAGDLLPSDVIKIVAQNARGMVLTEGSFTAHAAILTRSLGIPLVIVSESQLSGCQDGDLILVDADQGSVYINPETEVLQRYDELARTHKEGQAAKSLDELPAVTADGTELRLLANINLLAELKLAREFRARGVGLYRSEFPYIVRSNFPSEEEQYRIYRTIIDEMEGGEVLFRTLDVGGDKMLTYFSQVPEANPFLGMRAIRLSLKRRDIFEPQVRALLRAGAGRKIGIMFPMISSVDELLEARSVVLHCSHELLEDGVEHCREPLQGVMIEVPAAVGVVEELAAHSDFLCLGTNDLVQYMLAVDRTNEQVAEFYVPHHPSVLRALKRVADAATAAGKPLSICGEMAGSPQMLPFLVGIGIHTLSLDARKIPSIRDRVRELSASDCAELAEKMLCCGRIGEVEDLLQ